MITMVMGGRWANDDYVSDKVFMMAKIATALLMIRDDWW
jgi:hypothetical protein